MPEIFVSDEIPFVNLNLSRISAETKISDLSEISAEILLRLETFHESGPRRLLYHPAGQRFARNHSISYGFRDIDTFSFSAKIQDGRRKWRKLKFFFFFYFF